MKNKMAGLPHINLATDLLSRASKSNENELLSEDNTKRVTRRLEVPNVEGDSSTSTDTTITASETKNNVRGTVYITKGENSTKTNLSEAEDFYKRAYNCSVKGIPALLNQTSDVSEPLSIFDLLIVESREGLIEWPSSKDVVSVREFANSPIIERGDLNKAINEHVINPNQVNGARRLLHVDNRNDMIPEDEQYMYKEEFFPSSLKDIATKYRLDYGNLQHQFRTNYKNLVPRHKNSSNADRLLLVDTFGKEPTDLHKKIDELKNHMISLSAMIHKYHSATLKFKQDGDHRGLATATQSTREKLKVLLGKFLDEKDADGNSRRSKLKNKTIEEGEAIQAGIQDFIIGQAMTTYMSAVSNTKKYAYNRGNPSMSCRSASSSLETFYDLIDTFVFTILSGLSDDLTQVIDYMSYPGQVSDITGGLITLDTLLQVLMPALKMIPYVGGLFNTFGTMYHNAMPPVKQVDKPVGSKCMYVSICTLFSFLCAITAAAVGTAVC